jgi:biopolymer transport protein ExbD
MTRRPPGGGSAAPPLLDALGLALVATALAVFTVTLVVIPQLIAQRPSSEGVLTLRVDSGGGLRAWNQPIRPDELPALLDAARARRRGTEGEGMRLRLVADARVPWGTVKGLVARLEATGLPLELQLP